ncbi:MAG TPA: DUF342 domain-containing protein [Desulfotomaculum sp.]|nr:MAG: hypothetical protein JL56_05145 [Desulfotomaculum sp. BICA1-6]HBX22736.1 DUF342 domain-containing protein [Desulfotomaculum sp.]
MGDVNTSMILAVTDDRLKAFVTIRDEGMVDENSLAKLIQEKEIKYGMDTQMLTNLVNTPRSGTFIIAQGKPPRQGKDGCMQYLFSSRPPQRDETEANVDFREIFDVPSVNANTVLAIYHPAKQGEDGITVTGLPIPANPVIELTVRAGKGASLAPDKLSVTSTINGRPRVKKQGRNVTVSVDALYQHEGDVDIKSGNLRFNGDVVITGNITENMIVDINGNLKVMGFVSRSTVKVSGNLEVMKVITAGKINAGGTTASLTKIENKLREIDEDITGLDTKAVLLMKNLRERQQNIQFGQVVMALLDKQYTGMGKKIHDFKELVSQYPAKPPGELDNVLAELSALSGLKALALADLNGIKKTLAAAITILDTPDQQPSNVVAHSIWNSEVDATGNIKITGQGAFNSRVTALGTVEIKGVFRGGEMFAQKGIKASEIGGPMGIKTVARTQEGRIIKANRVYNGAVLQIGSRIYTVQQDENMVLARIDERGDIILH